MDKAAGKPLAILILLIALLPSLRLLGEFRRQPYVGIIHDDSVYWISSRSIALSGDYRIESLPGRPFQTKYQPLYPLFLALVWKIDPVFPDNFPLAATAQWLLLPVMLSAALAFFLSIPLDARVAVFLCVLLAVNPFVNLYGMMLVSEMLFLSLLLASAACLVAARNRQDTKLAALAGLLASAAWLTRVAALPMLAAGALCLLSGARRTERDRASGPFALLLSRQSRRAAVFALAMLPGMALWTAWSRAHELRTADPALIYYTSYGGQYLATLSLRSLPGVVWTNLGDLSSSMARLLIPGATGFPLAQQATYLLIAASIAGNVRLVRRHGWNPLHLFAIAYIAILLVWNWTPSPRLTLPLLPLLLAGVAAEIEHLAGLVSARFGGRHAGAAVFALAALIFLGTNLYSQSTWAPAVLREKHHATERDQSVYHWIRQNTAPSATFRTWGDVKLYLYTGRQAIRPPLVRAFEERSAVAISAWAERAARTGDLLLLSASDFADDHQEERLRALLAMVVNGTSFRPIYQTPQAAILRLAPEAGKASGRGSRPELAAARQVPAHTRPRVSEPRAPASGSRAFPESSQN